MREKEISSTDNLLDIIRGKKEVLHDSITQVSTNNTTHPSRQISSLISDPRKTTVGISLSRKGICFFAVEQVRNEQRIVDYRFLEIDMSSGIDLGMVKDALQREDIVESFQMKKTQNWFLVASDGIDFWDVSIPRKINTTGLPNAVYWAARNKKSFDGSKSFFDYYPIDNYSEKGIEKSRFGAYTIAKKKIRDVQNLFKELGVALQGISTFPFCCTKVLSRDNEDSNEAPVAVIVVEREWTRIDLFYKNVLAFSRRIKTGMESFADSIVENSKMAVEVREEDGSEPGLATILSRQEKMSLEGAMGILYAYFQAQEESKVDKDSQYNIMELIEPAVQRLIRQFERTFAHFRTTMHLPGLKKLIFAGQIASFKQLVAYIGSQLDLETEILDPFALPGLLVTSPVPASLKDRVVYGSSCAAALSNSSDSLNLMYSFKDRLLSKRLARVHRIASSVLIGGFCLALFIFGWNYRELQQKNFIHRDLEKKLSMYPDKVTTTRMIKLLASIKKKQLYLQTYEKRFVPVSDFYELTSITPRTIRLTGILNNNGDKEGKQRTFILDGYVVGEKTMLDSYLSNYIVMLNNSLLFTDAMIQKREVGKGVDGDEVRFVISVNAL